MEPAAFTLAQSDQPAKVYSPTQKVAVYEWVFLTAGMILLGMLVVASIMIILGRHKRAALRPVAATARKRKSKTQPDPWAESAKRLDPDAAGSLDDTVDIDPDELGPHDVDEGGPDSDGTDPHGEPPSRGPRGRGGGGSGGGWRPNQ